MSSVANRKPYFQAGSVQRIYQRPISQEEFEGEATLVNCIEPHSDFDYPGLIVEQWMVRFGGESETYPRAVTKLLNPITSPPPNFRQEEVARTKRIRKRLREFYKTF